MHRTPLADAPPRYQETLDTLRGLRYLETIDSDTLEVVLRQASLLDLDAGELLIREGALDADEFYLLLSGSLVVRSGERQISRLTAPGEIIGELAVLQSPPRSANVSAETDACVLAIRAQVLGDSRFSDFAAVFYQMLSYGLANKLRALTVHTRERLDRVELEAATDALTGLANRKRLDQILTTLSSARAGLPFSVVMADVDHFKAYNDTHGHPMGDVVLAQLAEVLQSQIRRGDLAARYGGEEFVLALPNCDAAGARKIADTLRDAVERHEFPKADSQPGGRLTATFGVVTFNGDETPAQLLERVDAALYRGKAAGRNRVEAAD